MKEYIKKFESTSDANDYVIADIPFTTSVATEPIQNLVCNQENKKIFVDGQGNVSIVDAGPKLISFKIRNNNYQGENGMKWGEWVESDFNPGGYYISNGEVLFVPNDSQLFTNDEEEIYQYENTIIIEGMQYWHAVGGG